MTPKNSAISCPVIGLHLYTIALTAHDSRALMRKDEWIAIESRNAPLVFIKQFAKIKCSVIIVSLLSPVYLS
jgi:hypothetical protein